MYQILQKFDIHWHDGGPSIAMMCHLRRVSDLLYNWKSCLLCYMKDVVLHCSIFFKWNKLVRVRVRVSNLLPWSSLLVPYFDEYARPATVCAFLFCFIYFFSCSPALEFNRYIMFPKSCRHIKKFSSFSLVYIIRWKYCLLFDLMYLLLVFYAPYTRVNLFHFELWKLI